MPVHLQLGSRIIDVSDGIVTVDGKHVATYAPADANTNIINGQIQVNGKVIYTLPASLASTFVRSSIGSGASVRLGDGPRNVISNTCIESSGDVVIEQTGPGKGGNRAKNPYVFLALMVVFIGIGYLYSSEFSKINTPRR